MSNAAIAWAFASEARRSSDKLLLVCLANHANDEGLCWPSQARLGEQTCLDRKTVIAGLRRLMDDGWVQDTGRRRGGTGQVVIYRLALDRTPAPRRFVRDDDTGTEIPGYSPNFPTQQSGDRCPEIPATESRFSLLDVPFFPNTGPENGTRNPNGILMETKGNPQYESGVASVDQSRIQFDDASQQVEKPKRKRSAEKTGLPDGWAPDDKGRAYAAEKGMTPETISAEAERFCLYHGSKGNRFKSWAQAWQTWCLLHQRFAAERARKENSPGTQGRSTRRADRLAGAMGALLGGGGGNGNEFTGVILEHGEFAGGANGEDPDDWRRDLPHGTHPAVRR
jgi:hypothetical protein